MNKELYEQIFRRKSFHTFLERTKEHVTKEEIDDIYKAFKSFDSLYDIKTDIKIVETKQTTCKARAEYCIMIFSEKKDGFLQNVGYLGEQLDLYLVSKNIGSLWFGIAKSDEVYNGLDYVIMIAIAKVSGFRKDMYKAKRKEIDEFWSGNDLGIADVARFAPSACNSQPWVVENKDNTLYVYRKSKAERVGIMTESAAKKFNQIDIGIFMCIMELCLLKNNIDYKRELHKDDGSLGSLQLNAIYNIEK